jgi:arylsulfatase A
MRFIHSILVLFSAILLAACFSNGDSSTGSTSDTAARDTSKPNIIYILADDLGYGDLSILGQKKFRTPHIDKLAAEGLIFTQHYSGSTVCAPSRSVLMSGLHSGHTPVRGNKGVPPEGQFPYPADVLSLPKLLNQAGYATGAFGKWGLGPPGSQGDPNKHFDVFFGYNCQSLAHNYYPSHLWDNQEKVILKENEGGKMGLYAPTLIQEKLLCFIERHKDEPFFCYVPSVIPHAELVAPESYMEKFRGKFEEPQPFRSRSGESEYRWGSYNSQKEPRTAFAAMVTLLDDQVGEIVTKLHELGIAENTLIIFTSDNGPHQEGGADPDFFDSNGPFRGYKRDLYEGGIRVPMIACWPQHIQAGSQTSHISAFWDVMPTVLELAGVKSPENLDGISFLPTLLGQDSQRKHSHLYWEFHERGGRVAIRKGDWKAVRYNVLKNPNAPIQLYNLASDPGESNDVAGDYPEIVDQMKSLIQQSRTPSPAFPFTESR